ncbi:methyltransferase [Acrocarpospora pleiomorpha]|uniref:Putative 4-hydroxy-4-methyl-2-oxoglutarate aldolase n=1 Tax=Acrocarpospora pleiomorpha TaxID=90975 RepID=A0A5M3XCL2_9ACTN|nr:RraA family protein [Acrocarpospora pleiomorpha]GES17251.1 methyltransferase [Acrocarpospora pleiomorpha]
MSIGFQVRERLVAATPQQAEMFRDLPVSTISDSMHRMHAGCARLAMLNVDLTTKLTGVALTVRTRPGDNLLVHKALTMISPGDVLVIDAGGDTTNAVIGEIMLRAAVRAGLAGLVVDGAIRDSASLRTGTVPVFARGVTHRGPYKDGPGEINVPVQVGGLLVHPGDVVVGDADGLIAVPLDHLDEIHAVAAGRASAEEIALERAATGDRDTTWIDRRLTAQGYQAAGSLG